MSSYRRGARTTFTARARVTVRCGLAARGVLKADAGPVLERVDRGLARRRAEALKRRVLEGAHDLDVSRARRQPGGHAVQNGPGDIVADPAVEQPVAMAEDRAVEVHVPGVAAVLHHGGWVRNA